MAYRDVYPCGVLYDCVGFLVARRSITPSKGRPAEATRKVIAGADDQPHAGTVTAGHNAKAVMLDFMQRPRGRSAAL
jgi:hypothetical protein